ncbi:MAG: CBS domain-containing protein [Brevefilum sp.]
MLVGERMSRPVLSVSPDTPIQEALAQMRKERVSRYPVINKKGKLVGIVSEEDLLHASPSDATSLSVWEINYLVSKITVERVMTTEVITVMEDTPLEEAARIMADHRVGGLPVLKGKAVVGMITQTDLFRVFLEMLGARESGVRVTALVKEEPGVLHNLTKAIDKAGGNIIALSTFAGESTEDREVTLKVNQIDERGIRNALAPYIIEIKDLREMHF